MNLHTDKELFRDAVQATTDIMNMREVFIEKDYWITVVLKAIFQSDMASQTVFKGGTSLSKCYHLIHRFSEDIDLVVIRNSGENDNQLKKKIRSISKVASNILPEIEVEGLTNKKGNIRKTVHQYDSLYDEYLIPVSKNVVVEASWLGDFEPYSEMQVSSFIYDMIVSKGHADLITKYNMEPFVIKVLSKYRTFCEKIMSLVRFSRSKDPISDLKNKIRHVYDIYKMLNDREIQIFFLSENFEKMLVKVGNDDMISYKNNNSWITEHPSTALIFQKPQETWKQLSSEYKSRFKDLVFGDFPAEKDLINTLSKISSRLNEIKWDILS